MLTATHLQARLGRITSSLVAAIMGHHPYTGPLTAKRLIQGHDTGFEGNAATERGDYCEPACLSWAADRHDAMWRPAPFVAHDNGWSGDSTDALFDDADGQLVALGEAKTVSGRTAHLWGEPGTEAVPEHVRTQCDWHLYHWPQAPEVWVPVLLGGYEMQFALYVVRRHDVRIQSLVNQARDWYARHIVDDEPVSPSGLDEAQVRLCYPTCDGSRRDMDDELRHWAAQKVQLRAERQRLEAAEATAAARLRALMGLAGHAADDAYSVTCRPKTSRSVRWPEVQAAFGITETDLQPFVSETTSRALTVTARRPKTKKETDSAAQ